MSTRTTSRLVTMLALSVLSSGAFAQASAPNPFKAASDPEAEVTYRNPVFHNKDLVHWRPIGHAIHRADQPIQEVSARYLSSETVGGFIGVDVGLYATGNGRPSETPADYDGFEYVASPPASTNAAASDDVSNDHDATRRSMSAGAHGATEVFTDEPRCP